MANKEGKPPEDLQGRRFGRLLCLQYVRPSKWYCSCDCGSYVTVRANHLKAGASESCGCLSWKHGKSNTSIYRIWTGIKHRCANPKHMNYKNYGAKGIRLHQPWADDFEAFEAYIGPQPSPNHSIDRINNAGNYEPGNVRWATRHMQANNKSTNRYVTYQGERYTVAQLARKVAIEAGLLESTFRSTLAHEVATHERRKREAQHEQPDKPIQGP